MKFMKMILFFVFVMFVVFVFGKVEAREVTVHFTAVADDGNIVSSGSADRYDFRYSESEITEANFDAAIQLITGAPKNPGETETYTFTLPDGNKHFYFCLYVYDEANNRSDISNLLEFDFFPPAAVQLQK